MAVTVEAKPACLKSVIPNPHPKFVVPIHIGQASEKWKLATTRPKS